MKTNAPAIMVNMVKIIMPKTPQQRLTYIRAFNLLFSEFRKTDSSKESLPSWRSWLLFFLFRLVSFSSSSESSSFLWTMKQSSSIMAARMITNGRQKTAKTTWKLVNNKNRMLSDNFKSKIRFSIQGTWKNWIPLTLNVLLSF